jgi:hypothetical protein
MKALGLYAARSLSYEGVEYELVEHRLTAEQIRIYDAYAGAFGVIHNNLDAALRATNVTGETSTLNAQAKSAARSAFESAKQRFFNHLITAMKTPSLVATKHAKAAPFKRNDAMLNVLPIGVLVFPGNGIQDNFADKARKLGIPVWKFGNGGA